MKKFLFLTMTIFAILFVACNKETANTDDALIEEIENASAKESIPTDALPASIQENLTTRNFDTYTEEVWYANGLGYEVVLGDEELVYFNEAGRRLVGKRLRFLGGHIGPCNDHGIIIPKDKLPAAILEYISANYPDAKIIVGKKRFEKIIVLIAPKKVLVFDLDGQFIEEAPGFIHCPIMCKPILVSELPAEVVDYITINYPEAEIKRACLRRMEFLTIGTMTPDGPRLFVFDKDNKFLFTRP